MVQFLQEAKAAWRSGTRPGQGLRRSLMPDRDRVRVRAKMGLRQ